MQRTFLSDSNNDYKLLENFLREGNFGKMPDHESNKAQFDPLNQEFITNAVHSQNPGLFGSYSASELADLKRTLEETVLPTRYDSVSAFNLINGLVEEVKRAAAELGADITLFPLYATVPTGRVNATAVNIPGASKPFLLFDGQLLTFCHLISKIYATSFVTTKNGDMRSFSTDLSTITKKISAHPEIVSRLAGVLTAFIRTGRPATSKPFPVDLDSIGLVECLRKSMEIFVIAHEFGHVYAGHLNNFLPMNAFPSDSNVSPQHKKEYEADYIGLVLTLAVLTKEGYDVALSIIGVKLFFSILDLANRYADFIKSGVKKKFVSTPSDSHPSNEQRRIAIDLGLNALKLENEEILRSKSLCEVFDKITHIFWQSLTQPTKKTGRNDQCLCGSGRKYKSCCMS
ncbi:SEC-C domain-containing protein [Pseudomonas sp. TH04]|uniref:SEC-C metal-binding domain-containing protein n=1 Tax=Pseudomonas sp. TH04 TaxID=2796370 RepID=UPI001912A1C3|nr:SEC-C metal-binding domain-containing protein [Pseudomonas sp. TH04]MBK5544722.1 SEC-C domain-containing protein [Pseudomonas sp. TH04]